MVSEESDEHAAYEVRRRWTRFWLVDPLDGTKEFIKATGEFTVNIALVEGDRPVLGVVYAPALSVGYCAERGGGAVRVSREEGKAPIRVRRADPARLVVAVSRDHAGERERALLARLPNAVASPMGSALKFCLVAEGRADLYPRFAPTMEWDTAAAQCVIEEAGGALIDLEGRRLLYNKESLRNGSILAVGDSGLDWRGLL